MEIKEVVLSVVVVCFLAQLFFMLFFYLRLSVHKNNQDKKTQEKTSLIICARNEKENLEQHLESFLKQDYLRLFIKLQIKSVIFFYQRLKTTK